MNNWTKPAWYLTPQEFANIVVDSLEENGYFKRDEKAHPEDIESAFSTTASAVATSIGYIGRKIREQEISEEDKEKKAYMKTGNLAKNIVVTSSDNLHPSSISFADNNAGDSYFENKYSKYRVIDK